jgi:hypothetical protein
MNLGSGIPTYNGRSYFGVGLAEKTIFAAQGAPPVSLTSVANGKKSSIRKVLNILFGQHLGSRVNI